MFSETSQAPKTQNNYETNDYKGSYSKPKNSLPPKRNEPPKIIHTTPKNLTKITSNVSANHESATSLDLNVGTRVAHQKFGQGMVEAIDAGKATINFTTAGKKQLLLKFAKLEILN
jgi:DNA helicase-2/ATP-dependent DNA helicase PcrA